MSLFQCLKEPPWRTIVPLSGMLLTGACLYAVWSPGEEVTDGRHDRGTNGIWIQHGWIGHDEWFDRYGRDRSRFRDARKISDLAAKLQDHGIRYVYPHLCPCDPSGAIAPADEEQTELFLDCLTEFEVLPWVGGVLNEHCTLESASWRTEFVSSVRALLKAHPRFAGVHVNIEPMPNGNGDFVTLLRELREALADDKLLSVAAYPPSTIWHPFPSVHWDEPYYRQVCTEVDQVAVMMYDTAIRLPKLYQSVMSSWTEQVIAWSGDTDVLLGVPAYDDPGIRYHDPRIENIENALLGIHAGLSQHGALPENYRGVALYSEWEMDSGEWGHLKERFCRPQ